MPTHANKSVLRIFATYHPTNCHAYLDGVGWRKVREGNPDGHTNVHIALTAARANGRLVTVVTDAGDTHIEQVYL